MSFDLIKQNFIDNVPNILPKNIVGYSFKIKKNGSSIALVITNDNRTFIKNISPSGVIEKKFIEIPSEFYYNKQKRDLIIIELLNNYTQDDVSSFTGLSQSLISNIKRKYEVK